MSTKVTLSDCARALDGIEQQISALKLEKISVERKIAALMTQGRLIDLLRRGM